MHDIEIKNSEHKIRTPKRGIKMEKWHTLLELKEDHNRLGLKGMIFFIVDFPINIETEELEYVVTQPTFTGIGVSTGILSYVLKEEKIKELFVVVDKGFEQYAKDMEENYFNDK